MTDTVRQLENIDVIGGHPAVDFVNTVSAWNSSDKTDYFRTFDDFLRWNEKVELMGPNSVRNLGAAPEGEQVRALEDIRALRDSLHALFAARANAGALPQAALEHLNETIRHAARWRRLAADEDRNYRDICCLWDFSGAPASAALGPVAWKAAELLELGELDRLKECPGENCGWLFLDTSKNRSRQWCSMRTCGNSAKVKRFRQRNTGS